MPRCLGTKGCEVRSQDVELSVDLLSRRWNVLGRGECYQGLEDNAGSVLCISRWRFRILIVLSGKKDLPPRSELSTQ
jgi:hypothetical protein